MTGSAGAGFFTGVFNLDATTEHRIAQTDSGLDIDHGSLWTDFVVG
jgi:hypothetical protein